MRSQVRKFETIVVVNDIVDSLIISRKAANGHRHPRPQSREKKVVITSWPEVLQAHQAFDHYKKTDGGSKCCVKWSNNDKR